MDTKSEIARLERERERERLTGEREELVKEARAVRARFQGL